MELKDTFLTGIDYVPPPGATAEQIADTAPRISTIDLDRFRTQVILNLIVHVELEPGEEPANGFVELWDWNNMKLGAGPLRFSEGVVDAPRDDGTRRATIVKPITAIPGVEGKHRFIFGRGLDGSTDVDFDVRLRKGR